MTEKIAVQDFNPEKYITDICENNKQLAINQQQVLGHAVLALQDLHGFQMGKLNCWICRRAIQALLEEIELRNTVIRNEA